MIYLKVQDRVRNRVRVRVRFGSSDIITIYPGAIVTGACVGHTSLHYSKLSAEVTLNYVAKFP